MITRIDPPLELMTPRGPGWAHFLIDYHQTTDLVWVCFQRDTGECWSYRNKDVRAASCETWGLGNSPVTSRPVNGLCNVQNKAGAATLAARPLGALCDLLASVKTDDKGRGAALTGEAAEVTDGWRRI